MASHVVVVDSTARRVTVKTTPGTYLSDVLDEACKKLGAQSSNFTLKHNNKPVDVSRTIRLANLPQGARLDLVQASRSPSVVSIALQLPESLKSARLTQKFPSNTSLWQILRVFESADPKRSYNFTQRGVAQMGKSRFSGSGRLHYEMPVLNVMQRDHSSFIDLQKTLAQLGINSGNALLRLTFRNTGQPLEEAMAEISNYFQSLEKPDPQDTEPAAAASPETNEVNEPLIEEPTQEAEKVPESASTPPVSPTPKQDPATPSSPNPTDDSVSGPNDRSIQIFAPPSSSSPQAAKQAFNESDYVPTVAHAKLHQSRLQDASRNKRLASDSELAAAEKAKADKLSSVSTITLRVRFPDQSQIEAPFDRNDTAAQLYTLVRDTLRHGDTQPFSLRYTSPSGASLALNDDPKQRLVADLGFQGRVLLNCVWGPDASPQARREPSLKSEWSSKARKLTIQAAPGGGADDADASNSKAGKDKGKAKATGQEKESKMKAFLNKSLFKKK